MLFQDPPETCPGIVLDEVFPSDEDAVISLGRNRAVRAGEWILAVPLRQLHRRPDGDCSILRWLPMAITALSANQERRKRSMIEATNTPRQRSSATITAICADALEAGLGIPLRQQDSGPAERRGTTAVPARAQVDGVAEAGKPQRRCLACRHHADDERAFWAAEPTPRSRTLSSPQPRSWVNGLSECGVSSTSKVHRAVQAEELHPGSGSCRSPTVRGGIPPGSTVPRPTSATQGFGSTDETCEWWSPVARRTGQPRQPSAGSICARIGNVGGAQAEDVRHAGAWMTAR